MTEKPSPEEVVRWQRRLASQANNRAWSLSEQPVRTAAEDEEMLNAAHAAMYFWSIVGDANTQTHAAQLLAHTYAMVKQPSAAARHLEKCLPVLAGESAKPWERALAHAVAANVASASGNAADHTRHYQEATRLTAALENAEERALIEATLRVLPVPASVRAIVD
ncbi:MAG: hypothetical protein ACKOGK_04150 [Betaproteobacteria bacterium]